MYAYNEFIQSIYYDQYITIRFIHIIDPFQTLENKNTINLNTINLIIQLKQTKLGE